jgi:chromosome segregation ATPase
LATGLNRIGVTMTDADLTHVGALLENIQTSVKVIAEAQVASVERFDRMDRRFDKLETRFDRLELRFNGLEARFDGLEARFDGLEARFDGLETKVDGLETKVDGLATKVDGLATQVDGLEVFASDTQRRLKRIEGHLELNGASRSHPRRKTTSAALPKRRKKA